jgi:hypothetical protein
MTTERKAATCHLAGGSLSIEVSLPKIALAWLLRIEPDFGRLIAKTLGSNSSRKAF